MYLGSAVYMAGCSCDVTVSRLRRNDGEMAMDNFVPARLSA